ncbi:hypothetical protein G7Y89_g7438 [Cudoniella acicularis]|uniref:Uncharacterized protein n=1 Tax=Cudoniella acicularis TaxID=354080 RepID=A0A8H4RKT3_9HELO|nr:hypothetical protein G7Y89_g7438 [Cudoniella acicularis]
MDYTRCDLTKPLDRMVALAGLADYMKDKTTVTYYGGLWGDDMALQLLWISDQTEKTKEVFRMHLDIGTGEREPRMRPLLRRLLGKIFKSRATTPARLPVSYTPSWSWMSIPGPISYYQRYPAGSAPSHPATRTGDAVRPLLKVTNLVQILSKNAVFEPLLICPLHAFGLVLPIRYDKETNLWQPKPKHKVEDLEPANLTFHIDIPGEDPRFDEVGSYALILAGK